MASFGDVRLVRQILAGLARAGGFVVNVSCLFVRSVEPGVEQPQ